MNRRYHGQFANQLVAIAKAYEIAQVLNRRMVEPELMASAQLYWKGGKLASLFQLFSEDTLRRGPVRWITAQEYKALGIEGVQLGVYLPSWACVYRIRDWPTPSSLGFKQRCGRSIHV